MALKIIIVNRHENSQLDSYIEHHLELALGHFEERISLVHVRVLDENGAKGGVDDKVCSIDLKLRAQGSIHASGRHANPYQAAVKAIHRAQRLLVKQMEKTNHSQGGRHRIARQRQASSSSELTR